MAELSVTNENLDEVLANLSQDIKVRDKWVSVEPDDVYIIVPEEEYELKQFLDDWLPLGPAGSKEKVKEYEKNLKKKLKSQGYKISEKQRLLIIARYVAKIKKDYVISQSELMKKIHNQLKADFMGYTYLAEIGKVLDTFLEESEKSNPKLIGICENKTPRRRV